MQQISSVNFQGSKVKQDKEKKNVKGGLLAIGANSLAALIPLPINTFIASQLPKQSQTLTKDEINIVNKSAEDILEKITNLSKKGVVIENIDTAPISAITMPNWLRNVLDPIYATANGKNAFFNDNANKILINKEKLPLAVFHEIGHAFNFNNSGFWKSMQKMRLPMMIIGPLITLIPAFTKNHKAKEGEKLTTKQKISNGIRNASPILAASTMLPIILEEGKATLRGNDWAKEIFKQAPDLAKKVAKTNKWGLITYTITAAGLALTALITKKVKDMTDEKLAFQSNVKMHQG